jgi:hypothetical protein
MSSLFCYMNPKSGNIEKCDYYGYCVLHYAVKSRNRACVMFLVHYEPKLIWMMDIQNNTAKHLAQTLEYAEIVSLIDQFLEAQPYLSLRRLYRFQIKEIKNVEKRRAKFALLMKNSDKMIKSEYERQRSGGDGEDFGKRSKSSRNLSSEGSVYKSGSASTSKIVLNENVTLLTYNSTRSF